MTSSGCLSWLGCNAFRQGCDCTLLRQLMGGKWGFIRGAGESRAKGDGRRVRAHVKQKKKATRRCWGVSRVPALLMVEVRCAWNHSNSTFRACKAKVLTADCGCGDARWPNKLNSNNHGVKRPFSVAYLRVQQQLKLSSASYGW